MISPLVGMRWPRWLRRDDPGFAPGGRGPSLDRGEHGHQGGEFDVVGVAPHDDHFPAHTGGLPCLALGNDARLVRSMASALANVDRVAAGSITSSTRPRSAA